MLKPSKIMTKARNKKFFEIGINATHRDIKRVHTSRKFMTVIRLFFNNIPLTNTPINDVKFCIKNRTDIALNELDV
jgi:hypothetical protein